MCKTTLDFTPNDINRLKEFVKQNQSKNYVEKREKRNVHLSLPEISRELMWENQFDCLLTSCQKSGPNSQVAKFLHPNSFPFSLVECTKKKKYIEKFVTDTLYLYGGIRFSSKIGKYAANNFQWLDDGGWNYLESILNLLINLRCRTPELSDKIIERKVSYLIMEKFCGIGTTQSRNYLQLLGLTRYEIPISSRFLGWLKEFGIPIEIKPKALSYPSTYDSVLDEIQELCVKLNILPCVLDACVFTRNDDE